ncbi:MULTISPECIES: hypothetical protein [Rhodopseudomonas]|uniref:Uncharacterized protein n=1 Tax=Rhodopseudomonas palustris TaxID=1076 RepID=A0A0D7EDS5_RHOPL|nr:MULTISPECIES: hypothetical protein [Rhodopseudomonas]KIZ38771.1 hypothetical protein OO17_22570 [Rhodopseudomonas palustris]MDF3814386.1 hypothetical protein [Rhodopseudomonas sp. BAL398]
MRIFDVECECGAEYRCAESASLPGQPGSFTCSSCGRVVETWDTASKRVYRCVLTPDRAYVPVPAPPAP